MTRPEVDAAFHRVTRKIAGALRRRCEVVQGDRLLVAVSGGADSTALLRTLHLLAPRRKWELDLVVGHIQHHLRGAEAEADADFTRTLAEHLHLPFERREVYPGQPPGKNRTANLEQQARQARYAALAEMARQTEASSIVTAHHADDQLETLLMRMIRGTGIQGLRGIAWDRPLEDRRLIRPMLGVTRSQTRDLLTKLDQPWREDQTNKDVNRVRGRLRSEVTPVLRDIHGQSALHAVALSDEARQLDAMVHRAACEAQAKASGLDHGGVKRTMADRTMLGELAQPVLVRLLQRTLGKHGVDSDSIGRNPLHALVRAIGDGEGGQREFHFTNAVRVVLTRNSVEFITDA